MTVSDLTCYAYSADLAIYSEAYGGVVRLSNLGECDWNRIKDREVDSIESGWEHKGGLLLIPDSYILVTLKKED